MRYTEFPQLAVGVTPVGAVRTAHVKIEESMLQLPTIAARKVRKCATTECPHRRTSNGDDPPSWQPH